jgi:hypothetical protein
MLRKRAGTLRDHLPLWLLVFLRKFPAPRGLLPRVPSRNIGNAGGRGCRSPARVPGTFLRLRTISPPKGQALRRGIAEQPANLPKTLLVCGIGWREPSEPIERCSPVIVLDKWICAVCEQQPHNADVERVRRQP